jgi:DNA-binding ferritin-like protein (Dps family)
VPGLESDDGKTNADRYIDWYEKYLADRYRSEIGRDRELHVFLSGADCYALRCAILHEGSTDITTQHRRDVLDRFHLTALVGAHLNQVNFVLQLDVAAFCNDVCIAARRWADNFRTNHPDKVSRLDQLVRVYIGPHAINI